MREEKEEILKEYTIAYGNYINKNYNGKKGLYDHRSIGHSKIAGSIFAHIIKEKIANILKGTDYHVSINNSYIKGCFVEWDLLICKGKPKYNIYEPSDVICAIELKSGGLIGYSANENSKYSIKDSYLRTINDTLNNISSKIKFLYISLNDSENKKEAIERIIKKDYHNHFFSCFVTYGPWKYSKWNENNWNVAKIDDQNGLEKTINSIIY